MPHAASLPLNDHLSEFDCGGAPTDFVPPALRPEVQRLLQAELPLSTTPAINLSGLVGSKFALGRPANYNNLTFKKLCSRNSCWTERRTKHWASGHPPASTRYNPARSLGICLYGVAGVASGRVKTRPSVDKASVLESALSQLMHIVYPAEKSGMRVRVVAHSWVLGGRSTLNYSKVVVDAYGDYLDAVLFEPIRPIAAGPSGVLSILTSLVLSRQAAARQGFDFDLVLVMRHDCVWFADLPLVYLEPRELVHATKCLLGDEQQLFNESLSDGCTTVGQPWLNDVVPDFWFVGGQPLLESFFATLHLRVATGERLPAPREKQMLHQLVQQHSIDVAFPKCGVLRSHPRSVNSIHFFLYRQRGFRLVAKETALDQLTCHVSYRRSSQTDSVCFHNRSMAMQAMAKITVGEAPPHMFCPPEHSPEYFAECASGSRDSRERSNLHIPESQTTRQS